MELARAGRAVRIEHGYQFRLTESRLLVNRKRGILKVLSLTLASDRRGIRGAEHGV
jgi:hypothetical protein